MKTADFILMQLKSLGPHSAKMLADKLSMTTMGIRQHMQQLEQKDLVCYEDVRTKVGRPTRYWTLTSEGHAIFPDRHNVLSFTLLDSAKELFGEEGVEKLITSREDKLFNRYFSQLQNINALDEQLQLLAQLRHDDGYMAELVHISNTEYLLVENHCPINRAADSCNALCHSEVKLFQRLFGERCKVERVEHIVSGDRRCAYTFTTLSVDD